VTIKFHSEARKEFFEAAKYYEDQVVGLGDGFIDEIEKVLEVIEQQPTSQSSGVSLAAFRVFKFNNQDRRLNAYSLDLTLSAFEKLK